MQVRLTGMVDTRHTFGDQLRLARKRIHLSTAELAEALGCTTSHVVMMELNQRVPDLEVLAALFIPTLRLQTERDIAAQLLHAALEQRAEQLIIVRAEPGAFAQPDDDWWLTLSADARHVAGLLAALSDPIDLRSSIVCEACGSTVDVKAAGRELLTARAIASLSEAHLAPQTATDINALLTEPERSASHAAAARISERFLNDFVHAIRHYTRADDSAGAAEVLLDRSALIIARGEAAQALAELDGALKHARRSQATNATLFKLQAVRGELQLHLAHDTDAERSLREAAELARPSERRALALTQLAQLMLRQNRASEALAFTTEAFDALTALDTALLCQTSATQAQAAMQLGQADDAVDKAERTLWLSDSLGQLSAVLGHDTRASADAVLGAMQRQRGQPLLALHHFQRAAGAAALLKNAKQRCANQVNAAYLLLELGMPALAEPHIDAGLRDAQEAGDGKLLARLRHVAGTVRYFSADCASAEIATVAAIELRRQQGDQPGVILSYLQLARIYADRGDLARAGELLGALDTQTQHGVDALWRACVLEGNAWLNMARNELASAHTAFDELQRMLIVLKHPTLGAIVRTRYALFTLMRGLPNDALKQLVAPASAAGRDVEFDRQIVEAMAAMTLEQNAIAAQLLTRVAASAQADGYTRYERAAENVLATIGGSSAQIVQAYFKPVSAPVKHLSQ